MAIGNRKGMPVLGLILGFFLGCWGSHHRVPARPQSHTGCSSPQFRRSAKA
jgi:hypothetical protein